jgi:hypothetical protein
MSKIFREGMQVPQDPDGGSAKPTKPKKKTKPKKLVLPPLRKGESEAPSDPDDGSIGMKAGGSTGKSPEMKTMPNTRPVPKDAKFGDQDAPKRKSPEMKTMPNTRPVPKDAKFGDQDAPKRQSPYMTKLKGGGSIGRGYGKARGAKACRIS